jgi:hypothetical protein
MAAFDWQLVDPTKGKPIAQDFIRRRKKWKKKHLSPSRRRALRRIKMQRPGVVQ